MAAVVKVRSRAGSWAGSAARFAASAGTRLVGRAPSPRASSVPWLNSGARVSAVRASVRCIGP